MSSNQCRVCLWYDDGVQEYSADATTAYRFANAAIMAGITVSVDRKVHTDLRPLSWSIIGRNN